MRFAYGAMNGQFRDASTWLAGDLGGCVAVGARALPCPDLSTTPHDDGTPPAAVMTLYRALAGRAMGALIRGGVATRGIGRDAIPMRGVGRGAMPTGGTGRAGAVPMGGTTPSGLWGRSGRPYP